MAQNGGDKMNVYLTIMVTILVITQIVRITQNHIQLRRQYKELNDLAKDISRHDIEIQKAVYEMLYEKLKKEEEE